MISLIKKISLSFAALNFVWISFALVPISALSERLVDVQTPRGLLDDSYKNLYRIDLDSPKFFPALNGVTFKYQTRTVGSLAGSSTVLEYTGLVWCSRVAMTWLSVAGVQPTYKIPVKDYYLEGKGWQETPGVIVADLNSEMGKVMAAACDVAQPEVMDTLASVDAAGGCSEPKDALSSVLCRAGSDARANVKLLQGRVDLVGSACRSSNQLNQYMKLVLDRIGRCSYGDRCINFQIKDLGNAIDADVRELTKWELMGEKPPFPFSKACNAEAAMQNVEKLRFEKAAKEEAAKTADDAFFTCAKRSFGKLDDKRSDASVIARVVYRPCEKEFSTVSRARYERDGNFDEEKLKKSFEDRLIEMVLTNRASSSVKK